MSVSNSAGYHNYPLPVGSVIAYANDAVPATYLKCDGGLIPTAQYPELYRVLGTTYNTGGEADDEFRVPDLQTTAQFIQGTGSISTAGVVSPASITVANTSFTLASNNIPTLNPANFGTPTWNLTGTTSSPIIEGILNENFTIGASYSVIENTSTTQFGAGQFTITGANVVAGSAVPTPVNVAFGGAGTSVAPESYQMIYIIKAISSYENFYTVPSAPAPPSFNIFNDVPALSGFINPSPILS
jgi:microcystin-dependent protein